MAGAVQAVLEPQTGYRKESGGQMATQGHVRGSNPKSRHGEGKAFGAGGGVGVGLDEPRAETARGRSSSRRRDSYRGRPDQGDALVSLYLSEISRVPLLSPAQERALARRIEAGRIAAERLSVMGEPEPSLEATLMRVVEDGLRAKRTMIEANLRLVVSIAKRYATGAIPLMDLIQEGNIGLIRAVERFDYRLGYKFSTYATWWIKQSIRRALSEQGTVVRVPVNIVEEAWRLRRVRNSLIHELGREPSTEELASKAGLSPDRVEEVLAATRSAFSLDEPVSEDDSATLADLVGDLEDESPHELITKQLLREHMLQAMDDLTPRERRVLEMRFGLDGKNPRTLDEVGQEINVTRERVRQIEAKSLAKLRHPSRARHLREYLQD